MSKIFIIAGEPSGDVHGSFLVKSLIQLNPNIEIHAWGGKHMKAAGANILVELEQLAFMGYIEVLKNASQVATNFSTCKSQIKKIDPDLILFIDYPGFNLRIAKWAKKNNYRTVQYIAPQVWAWKEYRIQQIKKFIDRLIVILPFEKSYFQKQGIEATYFGHPLIEEISEWLDNHQMNPAIENENKKLVGLFPGSRKQEVKQVLPIILNIIDNFPEHHFCIACVENLTDEYYLSFLSNKTKKKISLVRNSNYEILSKADFAIVTSGTATLEAALFNVPQVVCYRTNFISYRMAKALIKTKYISLVNLIAEDSVVDELIQGDLNEGNLITSIEKMLNPTQKNKTLDAYKALKEKLKGEDVSMEVAKDVLQFLNH